MNGSYLLAVNPIPGFCYKQHEIESMSCYNFFKWNYFYSMSHNITRPSPNNSSPYGNTLYKLRAPGGRGGGDKYVNLSLRT